jgi:hypothetical protein
MDRFTIEAITRLYPNFTVIEDDGSVWQGDQRIEIDNAAVEAKAAELLAEYNLKTLRFKRDKLLAETDYLALSDRSLSPEMAAYRQALRDITDNYSSLETAVFPQKP